MTEQHVFTRAEMLDLKKMFQIAHNENQRSKIKKIPLLFDEELMTKIDIMLSK